jgi:hypothetical protein
MAQLVLQVKDSHGLTADCPHIAAAISVAEEAQGSEVIASYVEGGKILASATRAVNGFPQRAVEAAVESARESLSKRHRGIA